MLLVTPKHIPLPAVPNTISPVPNVKSVPSKVRLASPEIALAPVTVGIVLLVEPVKAVPAEIPVRLEPSIAGKFPVNAVASIVVEVSKPLEFIEAFSPH